METKGKLWLKPAASHGFMVSCSGAFLPHDEHASTVRTGATALQQTASVSHMHQQIQ